MSKQLKVAICAFHGKETGDQYAPGFDRIAPAMAHARQAKLEGAQLAVFPECFLCANQEKRTRFAEPLDGPIFTRLGECAAELDMYLAVNHGTIIDGGKRNTTALINPEGKIAGMYHKMFPTIDEVEEGCIPGDGPVVIDTPIGRIGIVICFDMNFIELQQAYRKLSPDLILFNSYYRGGLQVKSWAFETRSYMVTSIIDPGSVIVNPLGRQAQHIDLFAKHITHTIEMDYDVFHFDLNHAKWPALREKYGKCIALEPAEHEAVFLLSATGDVPLKQIVDDIGLEPIEPYLARARKVAADDRIGPGLPE